MKKFYINKVTHEIHRSYCKYTKFPNVEELGEYDYPSEAIIDAKKTYKNADTCYHCCEAHSPDKFYINKNTQEIHRYYCKYTEFPNIIELGEYNYPSEALDDAKKREFTDANGCYYCCNQSHSK